jgi:hypothetical protein
MSPEALWGETPDASFDLWSLAIVLFESVAGENPVERVSWADTFDCITRARIPDIRELVTDCPTPVAVLFRELLHRDRKRRPGSATELRQRLLRTRAGLVSAASDELTAAAGG